VHPARDAGRRRPRGDARAALLAALLVVATVGTFHGLRGAGFVSLDDAAYLSENEHVAAGLSPASLRWAFTSTAEGNWHPLTRVSHLLDASLFGMRPGPHHLVSLGLHAASAVLLFLVLRGMTGALWRSAGVAAFFALHPLHVESVAWLAERKDVLSGLFWMAALAAHLAHARRPGPLRLLATTACLALGLMAKPMLVTLPFALLLLDYWPLGRLHAGGAPAGWPRRAGVLVAEKLPLFALSAAAAVVAFRAQETGGSLGVIMSLSLASRAAHAAVSYAQYCRQALWPADLAVFYPYAVTLPAWQVAVSLLAVGGATAAAVRLHRSRPALVVGWLWFLGVLVPVIGLVQVGVQARADRYTYLPLVGLLLAAAWGACPLPARGGLRRAVPALAALWLVALALVAGRQAGYWRDEVALYERSLAVAGESHLIRNNLGRAYEVRGRTAAALAEYERALRLNPAAADTLNNVGALLARQGRREEAAGYFLRALAVKPGHFEARVNLATVLEQEGDGEGAAFHYREALRVRPGEPRVLGRLERLGR
jgi:tetratricopeptide (TPR) repeat protein